MKNMRLLVLGALLLALASCGKSQPDQPANIPISKEKNASERVEVEQIFTYFANKTPLMIGADGAATLNLLGPALRERGTPSCAIDAEDTTYAYPGFELTVTRPAEGASFVSGIRLTEDGSVTAKGLHIGSSLSELTEAFSSFDKINQGQYTLVNGDTSLNFLLREETVVQITYLYDFETHG